MSAVGPKWTWVSALHMSALADKANMQLALSMPFRFHLPIMVDDAHKRMREWLNKTEKRTLAWVCGGRPELRDKSLVEVIAALRDEPRTPSRIEPRLQTSDAAHRNIQHTVRYLEPTLLTTSFGKPFTVVGFGNWFRDRCDEAGLPKGISAHGLRKATARRLADLGCSAHQIAAITGHATLAEVQRYTSAADRRRLAQEAMKKLIESGS
jgi:integrase